MPVNKFGGRLNRQIRAEIQGLLHGGRTETVVHRQQRAVVVRQFGQFFQIGHFVQRIGRRFQKQHFRVGADGFFPFGHIGLRYEGNFNAETRDMARQQACGGAEQAAAADQMVARAQKCQQSRLNRRHAGGRGNACLCIFQCGNAFLECRDSGVCRARISVALFGFGKDGRRIRRAVRHKAAGQEQGLLVFVKRRLLFAGSDGKRLRM